MLPGRKAEPPRQLALLQRQQATAITLNPTRHAKRSNDAGTMQIFRRETGYLRLNNGRRRFLFPLHGRNWEEAGTGASTGTRLRHFL
jgi:hypothetical protein